MEQEKEIKALFKLIDDPDEEVFNTISDRLLNYGSPIIPDLEHLWENTLDEATLERIEMMIYKLRLQDLKDAFAIWKSKPNPSLFEGALLVTQFQFPEIAIGIVKSASNSLNMLTNDGGNEIPSLTEKHNPFA